jgi:GT2 family glycosyltransferase
MKDIAVLILNYGKSHRVLESVTSLLQQEGEVSFDIFVADNTATESERKVLQNLPQGVQFLPYQYNTGYPLGYNSLALRAPHYKYFLILNPDIIIDNPLVLALGKEYLEKNPEVAIMGPEQINDDGSFPLSVRAFPSLFTQIARRTFLRYFPGISEKVAKDECVHINRQEEQEVDWLQSSCVFVRSDFWKEVSGFSEDYFLFMADTELCFMAWKLGKKVVYYPKIQVRADGKRCSDGGFFMFFKSKVLRQHFFDALRYYRKRK